MLRHIKHAEIESAANGSMPSWAYQDLAVAPMRRSVLVTTSVPWQWMASGRDRQEAAHQPWIFLIMVDNDLEVSRHMALNLPRGDGRSRLARAPMPLTSCSMPAAVTIGLRTGQSGQLQHHTRSWCYCHRE